MFKPLFSYSLVAIAALAMVSTPLAAQVRSIDPNDAIDADLAPLPSNATSQNTTEPTPADRENVQESSTESARTASTHAATSETGTFQRGDLIGAAEGVFGKGAAGLAGIIEKALKDQGEPNAYITGSEASGAFVVGLRYGSGTLHHKVEGERKVYWTGPSVGFDVGGNASKSFVLVYNLYDSQDLYKRFPQGEGTAYFVGGFTASYLRRGDIVLIPIRLGAGLRLGASIGYMKFTEKGRWLPF